MPKLLPRLLLLASVLLSTTTLLTGCLSNDDEDVDIFLARVKKEQGGKIEPIPGVQEYEAYSYSAAGLKSPFEPSSGFLAHKSEEVIRPDADRVREPLEELPLDSFKMVGVLKRGQQIWGLVIDKQGMIHRVREGNYLGQDSGRIDKIDENSIYILETISDGQGGWTERVSTLTMAE